MADNDRGDDDDLLRTDDDDDEVDRGGENATGWEEEEEAEEDGVVGGDGDGDGGRDDDDDEEEDQEEMERLMMERQMAEEEERAEDGEGGGILGDGAGIGGGGGADADAGVGAGGGGMDAAAAAGAIAVPAPPPPTPPRRSYVKVHYAKLSVLSALALILYALRTRGQAYLALTYLTSSKLSYIVLGNAVVASASSTFHFVTNVFLGGLRQVETEAIGESIRWNVTETCIALTIFRSEVDMAMGGMFLLLVVGKCLHWAAELRGSNLRMTEEAFYFLDGDEDSGGIGGGGGAATTDLKSLTSGYFWRLFDALLPDCVMRPLRTAYVRSPRVRFTHLKFLTMVELLMLADVAAVGHCAYVVAENGPSVHILFGFEAAILAVTALSVLASYELHVVDGLIGTVLHHLVVDSHYHAGLGLYHGAEEVPAEDAAEEALRAEAPPPPPTAARKLLDRVTTSWRDHRATFSFAVELLAQSLKFLFYLLFFAIVFTYYGMPINIFREVYVSYQQLRRRLSAFANYRRLTSNMNERFESVTDEAELEEAGRTCIICRDRMDAAGGGAKKLPGCGHVFHRHCLREWLVQQQTCPTCRSDISANEARARAEKKRREREEAEAEEEKKKKKAEEEEKKEEGPAEAAVRGLPENPPPTVPGAESEEAKADDGATRRAKTKAAPLLAAPSSSLPAVPAAFPALYRSKHPRGCRVYLREEEDCDDAAAEKSKGQKTVTATLSIRTVPPGKIVLCTEMVWWTTSSDEAPLELSEEEGNAGGEKDGKPATTTTTTTTVGGMMLKMPDGYVSESDVERVASICGGGNNGSVRPKTPAERAAEEERARRMMLEVDGLKRQVKNLRAGLATKV